jgi:hypothetical protein
MIRSIRVSVAMLLCIHSWTTAQAATTVFFDSSQVATPVASGVTSDTISSNGYLFTYTRDKLFTGGLGGGPIGRDERISWPDGVEAQAVTTPPPGGTDYKARITLQRIDGEVFDLTAFSFTLLGNTFATGASLEIMPLLNGEDGFNDPLYFDASGSYGMSFSYDESSSPIHLGNTSPLKGFDTYKIGLFVDYAMTALTLVDSAAPTPLPGDTNGDQMVDLDDLNNVRNHFGEVGTGVVGDTVPFDGIVDLEDLNAVRNHFGEVSPSPVPEPATWSLMTLGACGLFLHGFVNRFGGCNASIQLHKLKRLSLAEMIRRAV